MTIEPATDALIVVDVQNDFVSGSMAIAGAEAIIAPINRIARLFRHVAVAMDWHPPDHVSFAGSHVGARPFDVVRVPYGEQTLFPAHCVQGSPGAELAPGLVLDRVDIVLRKGRRKEVDSYGAFYENDATTATGLSDRLRSRGIERVFCAGLARYGCVLQTALGARRDGFAAVILRDASAGDRSRASGEPLAVAAGVAWADEADLVPAGA